MRTISSVEMAAIDRNAAYLGVEPVVLMENAGRQVAWEICRRRQPSAAVVLCGPGNNGGDGYVAARHLANAGWSVSVVSVREATRPESKRNQDIVQRLHAIKKLHVGDSSQARSPDLLTCLDESDVVVDALLGTGVAGAPREPVASIIEACKGKGSLRVAVDVPSGMDADSGSCGGVCFDADLTVTFHCAKTGHALNPKATGELVVADIGIPREAELYAGPGDLLFVEDRRDEESHKGDNGVLLVVGGSKDFHGAPAICGLSAMRTGIDLAYLAVPESVREAVAKHSPSVIVRAYEGDHLTASSTPSILEVAEKADAVCIGPGLSKQPETLKAVRTLVKSLAGKPVVLDADALKSYAGRTNELGYSVVLTPHAGEFKTLTKEDLPEAYSERTDRVAKWAGKTRCTWAVKGKTDVIARGDSVKLNDSGTACMTVGGTGDCLTGVIGALLARGGDPFRSAVAGCFIVGKAGELATEKRGCHLLPTDVVEEIPHAFQTCR